MEQLTPLLKELAEKLGTTVEHLWKVLLQQTQVEIALCNLWMNIGLYGFGGLAVMLLILFVVGIVRDWDDEGIVGSFVFMLIAIVVGGIMYYTNYSDLLTLTKNPEYWALEEVLRTLGK